MASSQVKMSLFAGNHWYCRKHHPCLDTAPGPPVTSLILNEILTPTSKTQFIPILWTESLGMTWEQSDQQQKQVWNPRAPWVPATPPGPHGRQMEGKRFTYPQPGNGQGSGKGQWPHNFTVTVSLTIKGSVSSLQGCSENNPTTSNAEKLTANHRRNSLYKKNIHTHSLCPLKTKQEWCTTANLICSLI